MERRKHQPMHVMDYLSLGEYVVRSSVSVVSLDPGTQMPCNWGTGFMLRYRERHFLVTVYHVIEVDPDQMYIEMGKDVSGHAILQPVGGFYSFGKIVLKKQDKPEILVQELENPKNFLDIAFAEIPAGLQIWQAPLDFRHFQVREGHKITLDMVHSTEPKKEESYAFAGSILQKPRGVLVYSTPTFKYAIKYQNEVGDDHIFTGPEPCIEKMDYKGCSGAPILDGDGNLVAIARAVLHGTKVIYAFPISKLKLLIDTVLAIEGIEKPSVPPVDPVEENLSKGADA